MDLSQLNFAQSAWLWGLLAIPVVLLLYALLYANVGAADLLERFADRHLLPHLLKHRGGQTKKIRMPLLLWALAWLCGILAMAGPRWNYTVEQTFKTTQDLVIVLDLSQSMNAQDVKPSRIARAREEIEDLLNASRGATIGLVAYATVPHMVTPLTDDARTLRNLLPAVDTSLVTLHGDRLEPALEMAARMLKAEPGDSKSILVISDGDFEEADFAALAGAAGGTLYTMGIGTAAGTPVAGDNGDWLKDDAGNLRLFRLQSDRLQMLAAAGHGIYVEANYTDSDTRAILGRIGIAEDKQGNDKSVRVWDERFYIPVFVLALLLLPWFRRGAIFPIVVLTAMILLPPDQARAGILADLFLNHEQQAWVAYERGDYKDAMANFSTPYRRGVAAYRAGEYEQAATLFQTAASQKEGLDALYNLGNAQLMQRLPEDAITTYEAGLKQRPNDEAALHNLAIAQKMLAQEHRLPPQMQPPQLPKNQQGQGPQGGGQNNQDNQNTQNNQNKQQGQPQQGQNRPQDSQGSPSNGTESQNQKKSEPQKENQKTAQQQGAANQKPNPPQQGQQKQAQAQQGPGQKQPGQRAQQHEAQAAPASQGAARPNSPSQNYPGGESANPYALASGPNGATAVAIRRPQDVNADKRLSRVQSDPGSLLKNQFMIEDAESGVRSGANP